MINENKEEINNNKNLNTDDKISQDNIKKVNEMFYEILFIELRKYYFNHNNGNR